MLCPGPDSGSALSDVEPGRITGWADGKNQAFGGADSRVEGAETTAEALGGKGAGVAHNVAELKEKKETILTNYKYWYRWIETLLKIISIVIIIWY